MDEAWEEWEVFGDEGDDDEDDYDDEDDDWDTVGWDPNLGQVSARRPGGGGRPAGRGRGRGRRGRARGRGRGRRGRATTPGTRFLLPRGSAPPPGASRVPVIPSGAIPVGIDEPRVRSIVNEELGKRLPSWFKKASKIPGASGADQLMSPLGLGAGTLSNVNPIVTLTAQPQRPFRGERLVISLARSIGAAVVPVRVSEFKIGENSQLVGAGALPAETFDPASFGVRLAMSPSAPGILINLRVETDTGAVPAGESIAVTAAIIGRALWGDAGGPS